MTLVLLLGVLVSLAAAVFDLRKGSIPNALTVSLMVVSPLLHAGLSLAHSPSIADALRAAGLSLLGIAACGAIPLLMWCRKALGGGDVKLLAGLGGLLLPSFGFEAEMYVFFVAALLTPAQLAYRGVLFSALGNAAAQVINVFRPRAKRRPLGPALTTWVRLGPYVAAGVTVEALLRWRAP
jgi:Flp pilus assembly protein protease CpaA